MKRDFNDSYLWVLAQNNQVYRINSVAQTVDDYTAVFAGYNNFQFIDIAGRSMDTVFIATSTSNVIQYKNGSIKLIGNSQGLTGTVTSVGIDFTENTANAFGMPPNNNLLLRIGTDNGLKDYNTDTEALTPDMYSPDSSKVFEATYRSIMFSGATPEVLLGDTLFNYHVEYNNFITRYVSDVRTSPNKYGSVVNTAYYVLGAEYMDPDIVDNTTLYWGSAKGMFQINSNLSYSINTPCLQYLPGIAVNKITSILGLTTYANTIQSLTSNNLLIGTVQGLYFSSSAYETLAISQDANQLLIYHYGALGNVQVNDICVNAERIINPVCEDGVWVATDNGLYYLTINLSSYLNSQQAVAVSFQNQPDTLAQLNLCSGSTAMATVNYLGNSVQWYKDGNSLSGQTGTTLNITSAGTYNATLYDTCGGYQLTSNALKVTVINSPVFTFNYPAQMQQCSNQPDTLNVTYNPGYRYRWYTNGALNGDTTSSLIVTQSGAYYVEVSACTNSWVPSTRVQVNLITLPQPVISPDKAQYCAEDTATLSAGLPASSAYTFNWFFDGNPVTTGNGQATLKTVSPGSYTVTITSTADGNCTQTSAAYQLNFTPPPAITALPDQYTSCGPFDLSVKGLNGTRFSYRWYTNNALNGDTTNVFPATQSGQYRVEVSSCPGSWISSNTIQLTVDTLPMLSIAADKPSYCIGDAATLTLNVPSYSYFTVTWYYNGVELPAYTNQHSIVTTLPGSYAANLTSNQTPTNGIPCTSAATPLTLSFNPLPTVSITRQSTKALCQGQAITLTAQHSAGTVVWSTGETTDQISVTESGAYTATVTSAAGCQKDTSITLNFLPVPVLNVNDTSICVYKQQTITLTAPAGFTAYSWNGVPGNQTYDVRQPGTVTLTVTDVNGCEATQQIKVADLCADVHIPNTITPNGDGVNDTWVIEGLDATATVKVFTRWGRQVFNSIGYGIPFNGQNNGEKLSTGVYYYIVTNKNNTQRFSGWLTIIY